MYLITSKHIYSFVGHRLIIIYYTNHSLYMMLRLKQNIWRQARPYSQNYAWTKLGLINGHTINVSHQIYTRLVKLKWAIIYYSFSKKERNTMNFTKLDTVKHLVWQNISTIITISTVPCNNIWGPTGIYDK